MVAILVRPVRWRLLVLALSCFSISLSAAGADPQPESDFAGAGKFGAEADIEAESTPLAVELSMGAWYRYTATSPDDGLYVQSGGLLSVNAAYARAGAYVEWAPASFFQLRTQLDRYQFFGQYGALLAYQDRNAPFGDRTLKAQQGGEQSGHGYRALLQPTLVVNVGPFLVTNEATLAVYQFSPDGVPAGRYFWELEYDTLMKKWDRLLADEVSLVHEFSPQPTKASLLIGPYYETVHAMGANLLRNRVGVTFYYEPAPSAGHRNRYYFQAGVNTEDRNVEGQAFFTGGIGADFDLR